MGRVCDGGLVAAVDVRPPSKSDVKRLAAVLGRAFHDDPVMAWILADDTRRAKGLPRLFAAITRHHFLSGGGAEVAVRDGEIGAAALWDGPGRWKQTPSEELRMLPTMVLAFGSAMRARTAGRRADEEAAPRGTALVSGGDRQ